MKKKQQTENQQNQQKKLQQTAISKFFNIYFPKPNPQNKYVQHLLINNYNRSAVSSPEQ
jgi:hypothetical protein